VTEKNTNHSRWQTEELQARALAALHGNDYLNCAPCAA
jgi:hypothetical protein